VADEIVVPVRVEGGQLKLSQRTYFLEQVKAWPDCDGTLILRHERPRLSDLQRGYWFAVVVPMIAEETGDDEDGVHDDLLRELGPKVLPKRWRNKKTGKRRQLTRRPSIMSLNTAQMTDLIDRTRQWAGEFLNLEIPAPDPAWRTRKRPA
jgi:hypothetical protein